MNDDRGVVRAIDWRGLLPWLVISRVRPPLAGPCWFWPRQACPYAAGLARPIFYYESEMNRDQRWMFVSTTIAAGEIAARGRRDRANLPDPASRS
jgi:hypothetical protein